MKPHMTLAMALVLFGTPATAAGIHSAAHGDDEMAAIGQPAMAAKADRTIKIAMAENEDGSMSFNPASVTVKRGETVRLALTNDGKYEHEFVMDTHERVMAHKAGMEKLATMQHADRNAIRIGPQRKGEIVWIFTNPGQFDFACLIPGHYELGMKGSLTVTAD